MPNPELFVFDTNTLVSALLLPSSVPRRAFDTASAAGHLAFSRDTLAELDDVLRRPKLNRYIVEEERLAFLVALIHEALLVNPSVTVLKCRDPDDNMFLELAVSAEATCIVSGDDDLLALSPFRGIPVLTPRQFLDERV